MKRRSKNNIDFLTLILVVVLVVGVGALTNYNLIYTAVAGALGAAIGILLKSIRRKR